MSRSFSTHFKSSPLFCLSSFKLTVASILSSLSPSFPFGVIVRGPGKLGVLVAGFSYVNSVPLQLPQLLSANGGLYY